MTRGEGGRLLLPSAGLSPAILRQFAWRTNAKLCINGHEYLKRQLAKRGIAFEPLDNGILRCADPEAMQRLADGLTADKIDALLRKWLARLPSNGSQLTQERSRHSGSAR